MNTEKNFQTLSQIIEEYAKRHFTEWRFDGSITSDDFYKTNSNKLKGILKAFDIDIKNFLSDNKKKYVFNDSMEEIITMLDLFDNPIVKKIRLNRDISSKELLFNDDILNTIEEAKEFKNAIQSFMKKNGYSLSKDYTEYKHEEEFKEDLINNIYKLVKLQNVENKFDILIQTKVDILGLLQEIMDYVLDTTTDDVINTKFVKDKLNVFKQDIETVLEKYKIHFDIIYNGMYSKYPNFIYEPFPACVYKSR